MDFLSKKEDYNSWLMEEYKHAAAFAESIAKNPSWYIAASAHELPFRDNTFDIVTSHLGIFGVMDRDEQILRASVAEALRVVKPDGAVQLAPFIYGSCISKDQIRNQETIILEIMRNKNASVDFCSISTRNSLSGRAIITKK